MKNNWKRDYKRYQGFFLNILSIYNSRPNLKTYSELLLSLSTVIVFALFAIKPTVLTIIELNKELKIKEETSTKLKQKIKNLQVISNLLQSESQNIEFIDQAVPVVPEPDIFIRQIEIISQENSISILGFSTSDVILFGKEIEGKKIQSELPFTLSATGSYQNIYSFIAKLENLRRPIKFDSFVINSNRTEDGKVLVLTVTGSVPFLLKNNE